jgi:preprotein translocase subunit YajC
MSTILLIVLFVLAWVVLILPKQRELKRHNALVARLSVGDEVMSGSGIYGTITAIDGDVVHLEVAPGLELKIAKRAVAAVVTEPLDALDADEELVDGDGVLEGWPAAIDAESSEGDIGEDDTDEDDADEDDADEGDTDEDDTAGPGRR